METNESFILSYIRGSLSSEEIEECDILMASSPEFSAKVNQIRRTYLLFDSLDAQENVDTKIAWQKISRRIKFYKSKKIIWDFSRTAAVILLPLLLIHQYVIQPYLEETPHELITLYSAPNVVTKAILPDGSEVWLNSQSKLSYPRVFTGKNRKVELTGEAYFKVSSDKNNRFDVVTPDKTVVSAYGTEFNVNAYLDDPRYTITLTQGNIDISLANLFTKHTLKPGQKVIVDQQYKTFMISEADTYVETAWKDGKMVFRRESIEIIAEKLARKFGVIIQVEGNTGKDYQYTATFTDESLVDILELLKISTSIDYSISKQQKLSDDTYSQKKVTLTCK